MKTRLFNAIILLLLVASPLFAQPGAPRTILLRLDHITMDQLKQSGISMDEEYPRQAILSFIRDTAYVLANRADCEALQRNSVPFLQVMEDTNELALERRAIFGPGLRLSPPYHPYAAIATELDSLHRRHPSLLEVFSIGTSNEGRKILAARVSTTPGVRADKPALLFNGCHHANEIMGAEICLALLRELLSSHGLDPQLTRWVDAYEIIVIPVVNVDGYVRVTEGDDPRWRKNARETGSGPVKFPEGVDLNRNYDFNWAHGGSGDPESERYRGPFPFSEPEARAVAALAREEHFLLSLTYHSQGEVVYYPWIWGGRKAPDDSLLGTIARDLAGSIRTMRGDSCYRAEYGAGLVGQTYPWLYGVLGTFDFVVETGSGASIFPPWEVPGIVQANLAGVKAIMRRAEGPGLSGRILDASTGKPLEAEVYFPSIETEDLCRRMSDPVFGRYRRLLNPGKAWCIISKKGYRTQVLEDLTIAESGWTMRDVLLVPDHP